MLHFIYVTQYCVRFQDDRVVSLDVWEGLQWTDARLVWNPDRYGGRTSVRVPSSQVWTPDVMLYNRYDIRPWLVSPYFHVWYDLDNTFFITYALYALYKESVTTVWSRSIFDWSISFKYSSINRISSCLQWPCQALHEKKIDCLPMFILLNPFV